ncbi:hypothetical protein MD484_g4933, partial [Candolleomyces efflorescens]
MKQKKKSSKTSSSTNGASVTLLDFFNARSGAPTENSKRKAPGKQSKQKTEEVIVIDSDSDEDTVEVVAFTGNKRRKLADPAPVKVEDTADCIPEHGRPPSETGPGPRSESTGSRSAFGEPFLLQEPRSDATLSSTSTSFDTPAGEGCISSTIHVCSTSAGELSSEAPTVGSSHFSPVEAGPSSLAVARTASSSNADISAGSKSKVEVDIDLTLDFWETGDDEYAEMSLIPGELEDEIQDADVNDDEMPEIVEETQQQSSSKPNNAFSVLMSGHRENQVWKEADEVEDRSFRPTKSNGGRRKAPFYKVLQGMPIAVDAFRYGAIPGVNAYFLTHAHSDHYTNLSSSWTNGPIYCSEDTANLIIHMLSVDKKWVHPLPLDTPTVVPNTGGVQVTLIEANHCPGSSLFFFEGRQTVDAGDTNFKSAFVGSQRTFRYLHCGDFRASPRHVLHPAVKGKRIDHVYLDTTYLDPKYTFPPQAQVISACADLARKLATGASPQSDNCSGVFSWLNRGTKNSDSGPEKVKDPPKTLFVIGTYSIGKERIVKAVAKALNTKVFCDKRKASILKCQQDPELHSLLTSNPLDASVHVLPLGMITSDKLPDYLDKFKSKFTKVVGFRPTGWTYVQPSGTDQLPTIHAILNRTVQKTFTFEDFKLSPKSSSTLQLYPVPYSEHSSFYELTCFAMSLNWGKMIATVNVGSERSRAKMSRWVSKWEAERKKQGHTQIVPHRHLDYW